MNTIECVVKLRDSAAPTPPPPTTGPNRTNSSASLGRQQAIEGAEDLPPGYLQSLLNKILHNVTIVVNNLILKFFDDDIVLSLNVKSVECYRLLLLFYIHSLGINHCVLPVTLGLSSGSSKPPRKVVIW